MNKRGMNTMKMKLYERKDERIWCTITAALTEKGLTVSGHDLGPQVEAFFGDDEYEYALSLNAENTQKLFALLGCSRASDEEKLQMIKDSFENSYADSALRKYCNEHGIETSFWSWP